MPRTTGHRRERRRTVGAELVVSRPGAIAADPRGRIAELLEAFLSRRSADTRRAYEADLLDFTRYLGLADPREAVRELTAHGAGMANSKALQYKGALVAAGRSPATVNRRLSALRSVVALAKTLGLVAWTLEVANERAQAYRDTLGPGRAAVRAMLDAIQGDAPKALHDRAIIRLMYDLGLRRGEVASLRIEDLDLAGRRVLVKGKGRSGEWVALTVPAVTAEVLGAWAVVRGGEPGPLFKNFDRAGKGNGITGRALWHLVNTLARRTGTSARPHGIRHTAITEALDRTKDPRAVQRFSRHADLATVMRYDDNREDLGGKVAETVAASL